MSESKKRKTKIEKLKEEKKDVQEELAEAVKKQEQIEQQLRRAENRADFLKDNERRRRTHRLVIKGAIVEDITTMEEFTAHARQVKEKADPVQAELQRITKQIQRLDAIEKAFDRYQSVKPVFDEWCGIYFKKSKEKFKAEHEKEIKTYYACRRQIESYLKENGDLDFTRLSLERGELTEKADRLNQENRPLAEQVVTLNRIRRAISSVSDSDWTEPVSETVKEEPIRPAHKTKDDPAL